MKQLITCIIVFCCTKFCVPLVAGAESEVRWQTKYYPNTTNIYSKVPLIDNTPNGRMIVYSSNGDIRASIPFINGQISGAYLSYDDNGHLISEHSHRDNKLDGLTIIYGTNGLIEDIREYRNGDPVNKVKRAVP